MSNQQEEKKYVCPAMSKEFPKQCEEDLNGECYHCGRNMLLDSNVFSASYPQNEAMNSMEERFNDKFARDANRKAMLRNSSVPIVELLEMKDFIKSEILLAQKALMDAILEKTNNYKCAACDGVKCSHTLACKMVEDIIEVGKGFGI